MKGKFLIVGALVGGFVLFLWGFVTHALIGEKLFSTVLTFKDEKAVLDAVKANAPANGVYYLAQGVLVAVAFAPDFADRTKNITPFLIREFLSNVVTGFLLAWLLLGARSTSAGGRGGYLAVMGLAATAAILYSYSNWYGLSPGMVLTDALDTVVGWLLVGLILGAIQKKMVPLTA